MWEWFFVTEGDSHLAGIFALVLVAFLILYASSMLNNSILGLHPVSESLPSNF